MAVHPFAVVDPDAWVHLRRDGCGHDCEAAPVYASPIQLDREAVKRLADKLGFSDFWSKGLK